MKNPTAAGVARELSRLSRDAGSFDAARYFRGDHRLRFYNVGTSATRALALAIYRDNRAAWSVSDAMAFADALMPSAYLEAKAIGIEVVARYRRSFTPALLAKWKRWLAGGLSANWATTDAICGLLIGPLLEMYPALAPRMQTWSRDRTMWVRRAAAVSLIPSVRHGAQLDLAYDIAAALHADREDLIQKAVGWLLREAGKQNPARLERYLRTTASSIPRTTVRYAIEKFSEGKRQALLKATRT